MARQMLTDGVRWFDPSKAKCFAEDTWWNGNNHVSVNTGDQFAHEKLYRTKKGRWILHSWSQWQGSRETYEEVDQETAYAWLLKNDHEGAIPTEYVEAAEA